MRISDWSSDVCSSDLLRAAIIGCNGNSGAAEQGAAGTGEKDDVILMTVDDVDQHRRQHGDAETAADHADEKQDRRRAHSGLAARGGAKDGGFHRGGVWAGAEAESRGSGAGRVVIPPKAAVFSQGRGRSGQ